MNKYILSLLFTRGMSLELWVSLGLFDREKLLYEEHLKQNNLKKIYWFTYGTKDKEIAASLRIQGALDKDIEVIQMPLIFKGYKIGSFIYSLILPIIHKEIFNKSDILKSNQIDGSWSGLLASKLYNKPFINRTGYTLSVFAEKKNLFKFIQLAIGVIERFTYKYSSINVVSSNEDKNYLINKYGVSEDKIEVIVNYIDTDLFRPLGFQKYSDRIVFVGRLDAQKNLFNLIKAMSKTNLILDVYGDGPLKKQLISFSEKMEVVVNFKGIVANKDLPIILNKYKYYILISFYEGMPKTLLEAMACGCICLGTNVSGIREVINNEVNGYLSEEVDFSGIANLIYLVVNSENKENISINARNTILNYFSLKEAAKNELLVFSRVN